MANKIMIDDFNLQDESDPELSAPTKVYKKKTTAKKAMPKSGINMDGEVAMLDSALRKMCALIAIEESLSETDNIIAMAHAACDVATTIKYLRSEKVYDSPTHYSDEDLDMMGGFIPLGLDE